MPAAATPATARTTRVETKSCRNRWARAAARKTIKTISANSRRPYWMRNLTSSRFMLALVMTKMTGSPAASARVTPSDPANCGWLAVTAALPRLPVMVTRAPTSP